MQTFSRFLLYKTIKAARKGANETLELEHHKVRRNLRIGSLGLLNKEVDMESVFGLLEPLEQVSLGFGKVIHQVYELHLYGLFLGVFGTPVHRLDEFGGIMDKLGFIAADKEVTTYRCLVRRSARKSEQFAIIIQGTTGGTEASAFDFALHNYYRICQAGYDTVALEEIAGKGLRSLRVFGDEPAILHRRVRFVDMLIRVHLIQTVSEHHDGRYTVLNGGSMGGDIDAVRPAGDDRDGLQLSRQIAHQGIRQFASAFGSMARTYDSYDMALHRRDIPFDVELSRLIVTLPQTVRIVLIVRLPNADGIRHDLTAVGQMHLDTITEVTCIAQTGNDIFLVVEDGVDRGAPQRDIGTIVQFATHVVDGLRRSDGAAEVGVGRFAVTQEGQIPHLHRHTCRQHRIGYDEGLSFDRRRRHILGYDLQFTFAIDAAIGAKEGILGAVKDVKKSLMQRQSGAEDGSQHELIGDGVDRRDTKGCLHVGLIVIQRLADLYGHKLTDTLNVTTETERVLLDLHVANLAQEHIEHTIVLGEIDDLHYFIFLVAFNSAFNSVERCL